MRTRHLLTGLVALTVVGSATVAIAAGDPPPRIAFVARSDNPADALAAGPIAGQLGAPLFTTPPTSLAPEAQAGLGAYGPDLVIITGGEGAVSLDVERTIETALGLPDDKVVRASGPNRHATAAAIVDLLGTYNPAWLGIGGTSADTDAVGGTPAADVVTTGPIEITTADWFQGWPETSDPNVAITKYGALTEVTVAGASSSSHAIVMNVEPSLPNNLFGRDMVITGVRHCQDIFPAGDVAIERRDLSILRWSDDGYDYADSIDEDTSIGPEVIADSSGPGCADWDFDPIAIDESTSVSLDLVLDFDLVAVDQKAQLGPVTFFLEPAS